MAVMSDEHTGRRHCKCHGCRLVSAERKANARLRAGSVPGVPSRLGYRALAVSCAGGHCSELVTTLPLRRTDQPRDVQALCKACRSAWRRRNRPRTAPRDAARRAIKHAPVRDVATHNGQQWTGPELEIVMRRDLSIEAIALMLGRTCDAVSQQRYLINVEPKKAWLAGAPEVKVRPVRLPRG